MSVLFLVLDGMPVRHVGPAHTPSLAALAADGGWNPRGGVAVAPSSTYPNHATFVTGRSPRDHGVHGNCAAPAGPRGDTLFDACRAAGRSSAAVLGDHHLVGVVRADRADDHWPPHGQLPAGTALDGLGYAADAEVLARLLPVLEAAPDLVVAHFNEPDTTEHLHGPDSEAAFAQYRATDAALGEVLEALRARWEDWTVVVVSDHDQETVTDPEPVDVAAAAAQHAAGVRVVAEGGSALVLGPDADPRWLDGVPGLAGHQEVGDDVRLAWTEPGRYVGEQPVPLHGVHGGPGQDAQVAVCGGGHPGARALAARVQVQRPTAASWYGTVLDLLDHPQQPRRRAAALGG